MDPWVEHSQLSFGHPREFLVGSCGSTVTYTGDVHRHPSGGPGKDIQKFSIQGLMTGRR